MRTPKPFYAQPRLLYQPALLTCPPGGALLVMGHSLAWTQTVPTLDRVLAVASRPGRGPHDTGAGSGLRLLSAAAPRLALPHAPSGDDVRVRMGWWRSQHHAPSRERPAEWASPVRLAVAPVRARSQPGSLPLLACHERQPRDRLAQSATAPGGWSLARDGLAPAGGEPQRWCMRARPSGWPWRRGWLSQPEHPPCAAVLQPRTPLEWPMLAVRSDQPTGVRPAVTTVFPARRAPLCPAHSLRHLAEPLAAAEAACPVALRQAVRQPVGAVRRQAPQAPPAPRGGWTVPGVVPRPSGPPPAPWARAAQRPPPSAAPAATGPEAAALVPARGRHTRSRRTRNGRPPLRLAGLETSERRDHVARVRRALVAARSAPRRAQRSPGLPWALSPCAHTSQALHHGAAWLRDLASI